MISKKLIIVDPFKSVLLEDADFNGIIPLGEGNQGIIYAVLYNGEKYVLKTLVHKKTLMCCSVTSFPSGDFRPELSGQFNEEEIFQKIRVVVNKKRIKRKVSFDAHREVTSEHTDINSHNIVKLEGIIDHEGREFALIPYCDIFLNDLIDEKFQGLTGDHHIITVCDIIIDIVKALKYLNYNKDYVHRDIKPENIALCGDKWCLIDFECAVKVGTKNPDVLGSPLYMHPSGFYNSENLALPGNDHYALGCVIKDMLYVEHEFDTSNLHRMVMEKSEKYINEIHKKWDPMGASTRSESFLSLEFSNPKDKLINLSNRLCCLMSDQITVDEISENVERIRRDLLNDSKSVNIRSFLSSFKSDGFFQPGSSNRSPLLDRRTSMWYQEPLSESDTEDVNNAAFEL